MTTTGLDTFDSTLQKTNLWLNDVASRLSLDNRHQAYLVLRAVLHALRDRLTVEEAAQLGAQLPMLVRGFYYEGWTPTGKPLKWHMPQFLTAICDSYALCGELDPERVARAVFKVLATRVSEGEIDDVKHVLPKELRGLWP
jgi:uncharacterized protein (DUF2267 family)